MNFGVVDDDGDDLDVVCAECGLRDPDGEDEEDVVTGTSGISCETVREVVPQCLCNCKPVGRVYV